MKKFLIPTMLLAAAPAFAGDATLAPLPIVTPTPTPAAPAAAACPISMEIAGFYGHAINDIYRHGAGSVKDIDVAGVDLTAVYTINKNESINIRFGYSFGDEQEPTCRLAGEKWETDVNTFFLMPGYRYTHALTDSLSVYAGANVGIASVSVKDKYRTAEASEHAHDSDFGFAYSVELGLRLEVSESGELFAAYQFFGSSADPDVAYPETEPMSVHQQTYNSFRVGYSVKF